MSVVVGPVAVIALRDAWTCALARVRQHTEFSKRLSTETAVEVIGGSDTYAPMCRSCYFGNTPAAAGAPSPPRGRVELVIGPMFSGKSTELLRRIRRYRFARKECLYVPLAGVVCLEAG